MPWCVDPRGFVCEVFQQRLTRTKALIPWGRVGMEVCPLAVSRVACQPTY